MSSHFQQELFTRCFPLSIEDQVEGPGDLVTVLAETLPKLVPSLVLGARGEVIPLLLITISQHQDSKVKD